MTDLMEIRADCDRLAARLQGRPSGAELRALYLDMAPVVGQVQGAVGETVRGREETDLARQAEQALERLKSGSRQVGLDIRLSSEAALHVGLQTVLQSAYETLDALDRLD